MAHVELSLTSAFVPQARTPADAEFVSAIERWAATAATAAEPCLVIDKDLTILAVSPSAAELLELGKPADVVGQRLETGVLRLIDFTAEPEALEETEAEKIPPLLAIRSGRLARSLIRVKSESDAHTTADAIATPLLDGEVVAGSLTFFSAVRY